MSKAVPKRIEEQLRSVFPEGAISRVEVLGYGDDPAVEPGDTAVRVFIDRAGRPEEDWDSHKTLNDWAEANSDGIGRLHEGLLPLIAWIEFVPDSPERRARPYDQTFGGMKRFIGKRSDVMDEAPGGARVGTWLGPNDLATLDALIMAGVGTSRSEVVRWALGRIRENPAYAQLLGRIREIDGLKAQF